MRETMKKVTQGATRLVALALGLGLAAAGWADATLSHSGFVPSGEANKAKVFSGVTLSDINSGKYVLVGKLGGGNVDNKGGQALAYSYTLSSGILTVIFQRVDGGHCKCVEVKLTEDSGTIYAYAYRAGYLTGGQPGLSASQINWWGTVVTSNSDAGYGIYDICLSNPGGSSTVTNQGAGSGNGVGNIAVTDTYTLQLVADSPFSSGGYVRLNSFAFGMNSSSDTLAAQYVTCSDYKGDTITSALVNGTGSVQTSTKFSNNSLKQSYSFGSECIVKVGTTYAFALKDADGESVGQRVYCRKTTDRTYSPVAQSTSMAAEWRMTQELKATVLASLETSTGGTWSSLPFVDAPTTAWSDSSYAPVIMVVTDDCTITLDTAVSVESIIFDVAAGKTLTLSGNYTITAANGIYVRGGTVATSYGATFSGTLKGNGTVAYTTNAPSGIVLTDADWTGTVWLRGVSVTNFRTDTYANSSSGAKVKVSGVTGWISTANPSNAELILDNDTYGFAFKIDNANSINSSDQCSQWKKLSGSGLLTTGNNNYQTPCVKIYDATGFTGSINANEGNVKLIAVFCAENETFSPSIFSRLGNSNGKILVSAGSSDVSVAAEKTWTAPGGIFIDGLLTVKQGAIIPAIGTGSTGGVVATGAATVNGVVDSAISASLTFALGNLSVVDTSVTTLTIPADTTPQAETFKPYMGTEKLDLTGCTSLATLKLNLGASTTFDLSKVLLPESCTTVMIDVDSGRDLTGYSVSNLGTATLVFSARETRAEYANGTFSVANVPSGATVSVARADGTTSNATVTDGTARFADYGMVKISGAATDLDLTCTNTINFGYASFTGASTWRDYEPVYTEDGVYVRAGVYTSGTVGNYIANNSSTMTIAVVGQMSPTANTIFLSLGNSSASGLILARTATTDEVTIGYNDGSTVHKITNMTVPNCATSRHVYIITKEDGETTTTFTVYLDGIKWKTLAISKLTLTGGGVQVAADFGGYIRTKAQSDYDGAAFVVIPNSESETGVLNAIRMYSRVITPAEIAEYTAVFPYTSPNGSSARTFIAAKEDWIDTTEASEVWVNSTGGNAGTPLSGAALNVTANVETEVTVNLAAETSYEALTIGGAPTTFVLGSGGRKIKVTGMTVIGGTVVFKYGAVDVSGGPMTITEDGDITFDMSGYDASTVYSPTDVPLTSDVDQNDTKVHLVAPATPYRTYSLVYTSGHYAMRIAPERTTPATVYYTGGSWTASVDFPVATTDGGAVSTIVFPGDTLVIPSSLTGDNANSATVGAVLPACVTSITFEKNYTLNLTSTDAGDEITFNVPSGVTLTLNGTLTAGIINLTGGGTVVCSAGNTLTGTIKGSVTVTYPEHVLPTGAVWTDTAWAGTNVLTNCGRQNNDEKYTETHGIVRFAQYGNANSFIRAPGYNGISAAADQNTTCEATLIVDADTTFELNHGTDSSATEFDSHGAGYRFKKLVGAGTLRLDGTTDTAQYIFDNVDGFTGTVEITFPAEGGRKSFLFGAEDYTEILRGAYAANLVIVDDVEVAAGKTWDVPAGIIINPDKTLTLGSGATVKALSPASAGKISVPTGTATVQGVTNGTFNADIEIGSGATLKVVDTSLKTLTIPADAIGGTYSNSGVLDLSECAALETLHFVLGSSTNTDFGTAKLLLPSSCTNLFYDIGSVRDLDGYTLPAVASGTSIAYFATETIDEYASGGFTVSNVTGEAVVWLIRQNGALIKTAASGTDRTYVGGRSFAGAACWHEWDFEQSDLKDSGACTTNGTTVISNELTIVSGIITYKEISVSGQEPKTAIPASLHPYPTKELQFPADTTGWSMALRCSLPTVTGEDKKVAIAFGDTTSGVVGLAAAAGDFVEMFNWTNGVYTTLAQLKVESPSLDDNMHIYVFTVTNNTVTLYRDGEFIHTAEFALESAITKFKVGDVSGRVGGEKDLPAVADGGYVDYVRLYDKVLPEADVTALSVRRPFVSAIDAYERTESLLGHLWSETSAWTLKQGNNGGTTTANAPAAGKNVTFVADGSTDVSLNLDADVTYGTLIFAGSGETGLYQASNGVVSAEMFVVRKGVDLMVDYDAVDLSAAVVGVDQGASLTFNFSGYPFADVMETREITLAGRVPATVYDDTCTNRYSIVLPDTLPAHIASVVAYWENSVTYKVAITPDHTPGSAVYYTGGYWSSAENSFAVTNSAGDATAVLPGDTVVIPSYIDGGNAAKAYFGATLPANVSAIRVEKDYTFESGVDNAAVLGGAVVTVASGKTLSFGAQYHGLELGAVTLNGPGNVNFGVDASATSIAGNAAITVASGKTLSLTALSDAFNGSVGGSGTVVLPSHSGSAGIALNKYGSTETTVVLKGVNDWLIDKTVNPVLQLDGALNITDFSQAGYTFEKITGEGNMVLSNWDSADHTPTSFIIKNIEGYSGSLNNNHLTLVVTVSKVTLDDEVVGGTRILSTNGVGVVTVSAVYVGNAEQTTWKVAYAEGGVYRASASYDAKNYVTISEAIDAALAAEGGAANLAAITVLDTSAAIPSQYYVTEGDHVAKCPAALVSASEATTNYYSTVQAAVDAANAMTRIAQTYDYVVVFEDAAVTTTETLMIKTAATVSVSKAATISGEFELGTPSTVADVTTYPINTVATIYTWDESSTSGDWEDLGAWRYTVVVEEVPTPTQATRSPVAGDGVIFNSDAYISVSKNEEATTITNSAEIAFMKSGIADAVTVSASEIVLTDVNASITVTDVALTGTLKTTVESSYVKFADSKYTVDAYNVVTVDSTNATLNRTDALGTAIKDGDTITFTLSPSAGYAVISVTANGVALSDPVENVYSAQINEDTTIVVTTSQESGISNVSFDYYASYTNAYVTASVTASGTYTLTVGETQYTTTDVDGTIVFANVDVSGVEFGSGVPYTITASGTASGSSSGTSNIKGTAVDSSEWMLWDSTHNTVGTWTDENGVTKIPSYAENEAAFTGTNNYTAAWTSTGEVVTVTTSVKFGDVADPEMTVDVDAQAAVRIGANNAFQVYAGPTPDWTNVYNDDLGAPDGDTEYAVAVKFNYSTQTYGVTVTRDTTSYALTNATGGASFALAKGASAMQKVSYLGAGSFVSIAGSYISAGYTVDVGTNESATNVVVSQKFVSDYLGNVLASNVSAELNKSRTGVGNGLTYFESYALGLNPNEPNEKPIVIVTADANGKFLATLKNASTGEMLAPASNVGLRVTLKAGSTPESVTGDGDTGEIEALNTDQTSVFTIDPTKMSGNVHYYRVKIDIGAK